MRATWAPLAYLLVLSFELVLYMVGAIYLGRKLNEVWVREFDWVMITLPLSLLLCCYSLYRFFGNLIKNQQKKD